MSQEQILRDIPNDFIFWEYQHFPRALTLQYFLLQISSPPLWLNHARSIQGPQLCSAFDLQGVPKQF